MQNANFASDTLSSFLHRAGAQTSRLARHLLRPRNLIVVCEQTTHHYRVSTRAQVGMLVVATAFFAWTAFSTGGFLATRSVLKNTVRASMQASVDAPATLAPLPGQNQDAWQQADVMALAGIGEDERVAMLEARIAKLTQDRQHLIENFASVTEVKSEELEHVIAMTGLNAKQLAKRAGKPNAKEKVARGESAKKPSVEKQGGPYVPFDISVEGQDALMGQLDRLVTLQNVVEKLPLARPIGKAQVMSPYGTRSDPISGRSATHTGMDFSGPRGSKILASNDGVVTHAARHAEYGNMVDISHGLGISTRYGHLSRILVRDGARVKKGDVIGVQGSTGRATGEHLHYEVRYNNTPLNPMKFLRAGQVM